MLSSCATVARRRSAKSFVSVKNSSLIAIDINLPLFKLRQVEHWPSKMSWSEAMKNFAPTRERYMREFDSPEQRLRDKNGERFRLP